jgi:ankyrin repeat protein
MPLSGVIEEATARLLLDTFPELLNVGDGNQKIPLGIACEKGQTELVRYIIEKGGLIQHGDYLGRTPLHEAARSNRLHAIKLLLDYGADVSAKDNLGRTPLDRAMVASLTANPFVVDVLGRAVPNQVKQQQQKPLLN